MPTTTRRPVPPAKGLVLPAIGLGTIAAHKLRRTALGGVVAQNLVRRPGLHYPALVHEDDAVGDRSRELQAVGHHDHRQPGMRKLADHLVHHGA